MCRAPWEDVPAAVWQGCPAVLLTQSLSVHRSGCPLGSHAWILIAMFHLAMDLASCQPPATGTGGKLSPRPALRHRLSRGSLWGTASGEELQRPGPPGPSKIIQPFLKSMCPAPRSCHPSQCSATCNLFCLCLSHYVNARINCIVRFSRGPATTASAPSVAEGLVPDSASVFQRNRALGWFDFIFRVFPFIFFSSVPLGAAPRLPCRMRPGWLLPGWASLLTCHTWARAATTLLGPVGTCSHCHHPLGTQESFSGPHLQEVGVPSVPIPTVFFLLSAGLAVHQIITITVSLIMVIAALITTLVLKNCCAQSGRPRRNSHQRKLDQQEESCQNLTDFAPARVPSALDIFTAYNETLQCSHECVRTPVPVYAEDTLHSPGDYKTTFNGNRPSSSDRHLIPVAFVSEKWFEISC
uniref:Adherens junctions associated protein 1 n=1 Tax=Serinus canaria TaxID=9135 RepID=A0A8C9KXU1_SERCA